MVPLSERQSIGQPILKAARDFRSLAVLTVLATISLGGCSLQSPESTEGADVETDAQGWVTLSDVDSALRFANTHDYKLMADILDDGKVTRDDYTESFDSWASCMGKAGTDFSMPSAMWNPTSNQELIRAWKVNPPAETKDAQAVCWNQYNFIKEEFQKETAPTTDPQLMSYVIECIQTRGGPKNLTPVVNLHELALQSSELDGTNPSTLIPPCVSDGIASLYPGLQGYSLVF